MRPLLFLAMVATVACSKSEPPAQSSAQAPATSAQTSAEGGESIGGARMLPDGTIELTMNIGMTQMKYPPDHPQYRYILNHLAPMKPGDSKPCPPFPAEGK